jgi:uncharacterized protein (DUF4415 family)
MACEKIFVDLQVRKIAKVAKISGSGGCKGLQPALSRSVVSLRVDQDVLAWFKSQGTG